MNKAEQRIIKLQQKLDNEITILKSNYNELNRFLNLSGRLFKYSLLEKVLIYSQKPFATACASYEVWNREGMNRRIKGGSQAIWMLSEGENSNLYPRSVFDVSDTLSLINAPFMLWTPNDDRYVEDVTQSIKEEYDVDGEDLFEAVTNASKSYASFEMLNSESDLINEEDSDIIIEVTSLMVLARCGGSRDLSDDTFLSLSAKTDSDFINVLTIANTYSKDVLSFIEKETKAHIRALREERRDYNGRSEHLQNRERNSVSIDRRDMVSADRSSLEPAEDGSDIRSDVLEESDGGRRAASQTLSQGRSGEDNGGVGSSGYGDVEESDREDDEGTESRRGIESTRPDEMGRDEERHPSTGAGDRDERSDLQPILGEDRGLTVEDPPLIIESTEQAHESEPVFDIKDEITETNSALEVYDTESEFYKYPFYGTDVTINEILMITPGLNISRQEIAETLVGDSDAHYKESFVERAFNSGTVSLQIGDGTLIGYRKFRNGILVWKGDFETRDGQRFLSWRDVAGHFEALRLLGLLSPVQLEGQLSLMPTEEDTREFTYPREFIEAVLRRGSSVSNSKYRIYEQFLKGEPSEDNIKFLKKEYGIGGTSSAVPYSGVGEDHDSKGIRLGVWRGEDRQESLLSWNTVEKIIAELVKEGRYLNEKEIEYYPTYQSLRKELNERREIAKEFRAIVRESNQVLNYPALQAADCFITGDRKVYTVHQQGDYVLLLMRRAMEDVIKNDSHLSDRAETLLQKLSAGALIQPFELTEEEKLFERLREEKNYVLNPGDEVCIDGAMVTITEVSDKLVRVYDDENPLFGKEYSVFDFRDLLSHHWFNDRFLYTESEQKVENASVEIESGEAEPVPLSPEHQNSFPTVTVLMSEHPEVEENKEYSILDYDNLIDRLDQEWIEKRKTDDRYRGYAKVRFSINWTNGTAFEDRQDIGDGYGGLINYIKSCYGKSKPDTVRQLQSIKIYQEFQRTKDEQPDRIALIKVGDFFESYSSDAELLGELMSFSVLSRSIYEDLSVPMVGIPAHRISKVKAEIESKGYQVLLLADSNNRDQVIISQIAESSHSNLKLGDQLYQFFLSEFVTDEEMEEEGIHLFADTLNDVEGTDIVLSHIKQMLSDNILDEPDISTAQELIVKLNLRKAVLYINEYLEKEFGEGSKLDIEKADEIDKVNLAYTSTEDREHEIQSDLILSELKIITSIDGSVVDEVKYETLEDLIERELKWLDFGSLVSEDNIVLEKVEDQPVQTSVVDQQVEIQGEKYTVESVDANGEATLENLSFNEETGKSVKRTEDVTYIDGLIEDQTSQPPVVSSDDAPLNFKISSDTLGVNTPKQRFKANLDAIRTLQNVEFENRSATEEEKNILSRYVGWGGLADAFTEKKDGWSDEFIELYENLSPEEYSSARRSVNSAFYTQPYIINAIYKVLEKSGFKGGRILEPSCGIGTFFGMLPDSMQNSQLFGVELDSLSGRIAKALYPRANVSIRGFEETQFADSSFDVVIGNIPFGDIKLFDRRYNKHHFLIHDYFFAKALDVVRPGGIVAFITSKGTLDKKDPSVRRYIAQRAELLGAIRLPNTAFKAAAGTTVTSDIIFLQKRERIVDIEPEWVHLGTDTNGLVYNSYFIEHPEMICGQMTTVSGPFGPETACALPEGQDLNQLLLTSVSYINAEYKEHKEVVSPAKAVNERVLADPSVRNFSFSQIEGKIYYRNGEYMYLSTANKTAQERIRGLIKLRDVLRTLIEYQMENYPDNQIKECQDKLGALYDDYIKKFGYISTKANQLAFDTDDSYSLLCSLEKYDSEGKYQGKADIFTKRTIKPRTVVSKVETASEALSVSLAVKTFVDMEYMSELSGQTEEELYHDLQGAVFLNPHYRESTRENEHKYLPADEYLSGNVRAKLKDARNALYFNPEYDVNVKALEQVQPEELTATDIYVRLGSPWVPKEYIQQFMYHLFDTPWSNQAGSYYRNMIIEVSYVAYTNEWNISRKSFDKGVLPTSKYGTTRINGYALLELSLNSKIVEIYDTVEDPVTGKERRVLNAEETSLAQAKQELIKEAFKDWIWDDPDRRKRLCEIYNERYNSTRPREYDGSHLVFDGMNTEIKLQKHQLDAIAHIIYGGNTLLGHVVGAGKTYEMVAAAQESIRLGLGTKALFVVPNHIVEQFANEYLTLYPAANILVTTKKDFEKSRRQLFCSRIATGDYDAVIMGHSQFEKIPISFERQQAFIENEINEAAITLDEAKAVESGTSFSVKELERTVDRLRLRQKRLLESKPKDTVVTFEELGVDMLFVDEAHYFKNLSIATRMTNVAGITTTAAQKSSDLYMKCRYLSEENGNRGIVFATGTPLSNSMVELYTMQRYLQYETLVEKNLHHFDAWAASFGETATTMELAVEGGYRNKTRFSRFVNVPELIAMFKEVADIKTADMINLPVPEVEKKTVVLKPSEEQKMVIKEIGERAEKIHSGGVDSRDDNMLLVTNDGRKLALDQRLIDEAFPDNENDKVHACAEQVYRFWSQDDAFGGPLSKTQLVFCDLSTPKSDGSFDVYNALKEKLIEKGIPEEEIAFIHSAKTDAQREALFSQVRAGQIRVLIGSTFKMGAGTNVQSRLLAIHHLDCPWRPSDLQQREGRIVRQGNENEKVYINTYVTESTLDSYLYQLVENKQRMIGQIFTSKSPVRSIDDIDEVAVSYAEIKAMCSGDPLIKEKIELENEVAKLKLQKSSYKSQIYSLQDELSIAFPKEKSFLEGKIHNLEADIQSYKAYMQSHGNEKHCHMILSGRTFDKKEEAGEAFLELKAKVKEKEVPVELGTFFGFQLSVIRASYRGDDEFMLSGRGRYKCDASQDGLGSVVRLSHLIDKLPQMLEKAKGDLENVIHQTELAEVEVKKPFPKEEELQCKLSRLAEVDTLLKVENKSKDKDSNLPEKKKSIMEHDCR